MFRNGTLNLSCTLVALGASFVWTPVALATEYYVSTTGSNSNSGTESQPFASIQWAADLSQPGDTTFVRGGTYSETFHAGASVVLRNDGTASDWINFRAYPGETPVIDHDTYAGFLVLGNYVEVSGFEVTTSTGISNPGDSSDGQNWGSGISVVGNYQFAGPSFENKRPHHVRINDNHVYGMGGSGITATRTDYLQLEGNRIHHNSFFNPNQSSGISLYQLIDQDTAPGYHNIIRGNTSYSNQNTVSPSGGGNRTDGNGIIIDDGQNTQFGSTFPAYTGSTLIENNVLFDNGGKGVNVFKSDNVDIINNTLFKNGKDPQVGPYQIAHGNADNVRIYNNILYGRSPNEAINFAFFESNISYDNNLFFNGITSTSSGVSYGANNIYGQDPLLTNPTLDFATANFRQTPTGPTINNGNPTIHSVTDFGGTARPLGGGYDIGAYEVANEGPLRINFEGPRYSTTAGHGNDGGLAGQGNNVNNAGCGAPSTGCWQNVFDFKGFTVTPGAGSDNGRGLAYSDPGSFAPHIFRTNDELLGGTFESASSMLDYSFEYRLDSIGSGFNDAFQFAVGGGPDHTDFVMRLFAKDDGGFGIKHGNGFTYLTPIGQLGSLLLADDFNIISGQIDYANQTFTIFINGSQYAFESSMNTNNGGNYTFAGTDANDINAANIILVATNNTVSNDATYSIDNLLLGIASILGDFDSDGDVDGDDIDALALAAAAGSTDLAFDLNGDNMVTFEASGSGVSSDSDYLIRTILGTEYGDANLDGEIDVVDFDLLGQGFQQGGSGWLFGDFSGSGGVTDIVDFDLLGQYYGFSSTPSASTAIPEPSAVCLIYFVLILLTINRPSNFKH